MRLGLQYHWHNRHYRDFADFLDTLMSRKRKQLRKERELVQQSGFAHSRGEYVFDQAWAEACQRAGIRYYPKWLGAVPFSPVTGQRLLGEASAITQLLTALPDALLARQISGLSSLTEIAAAEWDALLPDDQPFLRHAFLTTLEESGSVRAETGWQPAHLLWREQGKTVAALPGYVK
ncbi:hypothetical protein CRX72_27730 [Pantoea sp. BRM17]|nr:hypothetical protein CRX72_27730 [Pantoea sp. BRM17]